PGAPPPVHHRRGGVGREGERPHADRQTPLGAHPLELLLVEEQVGVFVERRGDRQIGHLGTAVDDQRSSRRVPEQRLRNVDFYLGGIAVGGEGEVGRRGVGGGQRG